MKPGIYDLWVTPYGSFFTVLRIPPPQEGKPLPNSQFHSYWLIMVKLGMYVTYKFSTRKVIGIAN